MEMAEHLLYGLLGFLAGMGARDFGEDVWRRYRQRRKKDRSVGVVAQRNGG